MNEFLSSLPGYFSNDDYQAITEIAKLLPDKGTLVELGTGFGKSAACWATILRELDKSYTIYTLDKFKTTAKQFMLDKRLSRIEGDKKLLRPFIMAEVNQEEITRQLLVDFKEITVVSYDIFTDIPDKLNIDSLQCVFNDANHSSIGLRRCFTDWYKLLDTNGVYSGHDYGELNWPDVKKEADSFAKENNTSVILPNSNASIYYIQKQ